MSASGLTRGAAHGQTGARHCGLGQTPSDGTLHRAKLRTKAARVSLSRAAHRGGEMPWVAPMSHNNEAQCLSIQTLCLDPGCIVYT